MRFRRLQWRRAQLMWKPASRSLPSWGTEDERRTVDRLTTARVCVRLSTGGNMALNIEKRLRGDVIVIELSGNITLGEASGALREAVKETANSGSKKVLLDLGGVGYIDSAGLGELVGAYATCERLGVRLKLLNLTKKVQ